MTTLDLTCPETPITVLLADDDTLPFEVNQADGTTPASSMSGVEFTLLILPNQYAAAADALITKDDASITNRDNTAWTGAFPVTAEDKADLEISTLYYQVHMVESGGVPTTLMRGSYSVVG